MLKKIIILLLIANFISCEDLIEVEDISNDTISILAPSDNLILDATSVSFSWEPLEFAEQYQLQIATPNFNTPQSIIEDTIISTTQFIKTLSVNSYQWRIRAKNFGYNTSYSTHNLTIED